LGFFFTPQLKELLTLLGRLGLGAFTFLLVVITVYLLFKIIKRRSRRHQKADLSQPEMSPPPHVGGYELGHP